jgi:hypothetical protein
MDMTCPSCTQYLNIAENQFDVASNAIDVVSTAARVTVQGNKNWGAGGILRTVGANSPSLISKLNLDEHVLDTTIAGGRLTLTTGTPVTTSDVISATTIYYTPYVSNKIALWDNTNTTYDSGTAGVWRLYTFTEPWLGLSGLTAGKNYDVFLYINNTTFTLELGSAWTNDTTRATALCFFEGVWLKACDTKANKGRRYLGTIRATAATMTQDSMSKRFVWNVQNQVPIRDVANDATTSWTSSDNGSWSAVNGGNAAWKHEFVVGLSEKTIRAKATALVGSAGYALSIALDSSTAVDRSIASIATSGTGAGSGSQVFSELYSQPGIGYHYTQAIQSSVSAGAVTAYGVNGGCGGSWYCTQAVFINDFWR